MTLWMCLFSHSGIVIWCTWISTQNLKNKIDDENIHNIMFSRSKYNLIITLLGCTLDVHMNIHSYNINRNAYSGPRELEPALYVLWMYEKEGKWFSCSSEPGTKNIENCIRKLQKFVKQFHISVCVKMHQEKLSSVVSKKRQDLTHFIFFVLPPKRNIS